jgi:threonine dehydrogenase-like Zn-dependent dehydrogenase
MNELVNKLAGATLSKQEETPVGLNFHPKLDPNRTMKSFQWYGTKDIRLVEDTKVPMITDDNDVIIKVTNTAICGSDLHLYLGFMPGMLKGDLMGHEFMGIIEDVGPAVKSMKKGDRVVAAFDIACGHCFFCSKAQ